jgi:hypothetical protein
MSLHLVKFEPEQLEMYLFICYLKAGKAGWTISSVAIIRKTVVSTQGKSWSFL